MKKLLLVALLSTLTACGSEDIFDNDDKDDELKTISSVSFSATPSDINSPIYNFSSVYTVNNVDKSTGDVTFNWSVSLEGEGQVTSLYPEQAPQYEFKEAATYKVKLTVEGHTGEALAQFSKNLTISVEDIATQPLSPRAVIDITDRTTTIYTFNSESSSYSEGSLSQIDWVIEGQELSGPQVTHNFSETGPHTVHLKVTAEDNTQATTAMTINVVNEITTPTAKFDYAKNKLIVSFDASKSSNQSSKIISYQWDFGNGESATGITASATYPSEGPYSVVLTVVSKEGVTNTETDTIDVYEEASYVTCDVLTSSSLIFKSADEGQCFSTSPITSRATAEAWCSTRVQQYVDDLSFIRITPTLTWQVRQQGNNEC
ncbi:hypothetical protein AKG98_3103 [Moritella sp. JT01]|uniref:PKD domain-containing protein n=1 Tax=Moritella sp. JT01 TaxID=756698 RepID=UPI000795E277|nr:PKD domain-containing protein [Moritella sp. JT01]KXO13696.1 hypothetical protein AKG98_3103 [Moritella sp. JT01]